MRRLIDREAYCNSPFASEHGCVVARYSSVFLVRVGDSVFHLYA